MENINNNSRILSTLSKLKGEISQKIDESLDNLLIKIKEDNTIVTDLDIFISERIREEFKKEFPDLSFFSEEHPDNFCFPMIILDPIDGTREFANGVNECAISFGVYYSSDFNDPRNFSWLYNPFTGFEIHSGNPVIRGKDLTNDQLLAFVSRSEFDKKLFQSNEQINYQPKGSIAYKLGLLAAGAGDFVMSKRPKNIWDIMAGTHLCFARGMYLFHNGKKIERLDEELIQNDLLWCTEELYNSHLKNL